MVLKEIRGDVETNNGKKVNKLICLVQFKSKSFGLAIKNNGFKEAQLVDIVSLLSPCLSETSLKILVNIFNEAYQNVVQESKIAS